MVFVYPNVRVSAANYRNQVSIIRILEKITHTHSHTHTFTHTHSHTYTHTHTHTQTNKHTHKHTHTMKNNPTF